MPLDALIDYAGLGKEVPCTTLNKMCGSGMKAAMAGFDLIASGQAGVVVAGGMESMSNAPYLSKKYRGGARIGAGTVEDCGGHPWIVQDNIGTAEQASPAQGQVLGVVTGQFRSYRR